VRSVSLIISLLAQENLQSKIERVQNTAVLELHNKTAWQGSHAS